MIEMKDSGIEWIGLIPSHWKICRTKFLCNIVTGNKDTVNRDDEGKYPFFVRSPKVEKINSYSYDGEAILMAGDGVGAGKVFHYFNGKFDFHQRVYNLHCFKNVIGKYFFYYLSENFYREIEKGSAKSTVDSIRLPMILNFPILLPSLDEQKKIVDFLDKKCSAIDSALDAAKKLVEKFREYKKSLITETVTKGLNPSAEFVDSNIEWLGEIPSHWKIIKLKFLAIQKNSILSDGDWIESKDLSVDGINYFTTGNVGDGFFKENDFNYVSNETFDTLNCTAIKGGDFIFSRLNLPMGRACIIPDKYIKSVIAVDNVLFRPDDYVEKNFILYVTMCPHYQEHNALVARGTTMQRMSHSQLKNLKIPIPPLAEQKKIADFLDKKCSAIDENISKREKLIEKLTEYKKSLIYEVVTGKLEV